MGRTRSISPDFCRDRTDKNTSAGSAAVSLDQEHPDLVWMTGIVDISGGLGILLPLALRIKPGLTVFAAYGIVVLMIVASIFHISRGEAQNIGVNIFFLLLAVFIAWGRREESVQ